MDVLTPILNDQVLRARILELYLEYIGGSFLENLNVTLLVSSALVLYPRRPHTTEHHGK